MHKSRQDFVLLIVFFGLLLTFLLGSRGLNEPDEGRYANIASTIFSPDTHWWEPRMSGFAHYDKPPLTYWTTGLAFRWLGTNEWAARATPLLGACLALTGLFWAAWRLYGPQVAWWATLLCGTLGQFWVLARFLSPDMLLTGWTTLAIAAWAEARHRGGDWGFWSLSLVFWTLAWWTKATAALIPLAGLAVGLLILRDSAGRKALKPLLTLLCILALGSPWYLWLMAKYPGISSFFFERELAGRVVGHVDGRRGPIYYHLLLIFLLWIPWLPVIGTALTVRHAWPRWGRPLVNAMGVEGWIVLVGLLILSVISSKLPTYTLPLAPWAALLLARALLKLRAILSPQAFRWLVAPTLGTTLVLFICAATLAPRIDHRIGLNSSVKTVAHELQQRGARVIFTDRYWPGMEFYFGPKVHYVVGKEPRQRADDNGFCPEIGDTHFCLPEKWEQRLSRVKDPGVWIMHYPRNKNSPFLPYLRDHPDLEQVRVGSILLVRAR